MMGRQAKGGRSVTYERHGKWVCLVVIVIMIVILINSQGCAKLILRYNNIVTAQESNFNNNAYLVVEHTE
jgi:hypothetical protein